MQKIKIMGFKKVVKEIGRLNNLDKATISERMCKVTEEIGEFAQQLNKTTGRKILKREDTKESIKKEILSEGADSIQCIISVLSDFGFTAKEITKQMKENNKNWEEKIKKKKNEK